MNIFSGLAAGLTAFRNKKHDPTSRANTSDPHPMSEIARENLAILRDPRNPGSPVPLIRELRTGTYRQLWVSKNGKLSRVESKGSDPIDVCERFAHSTSLEIARVFFLLPPLSETAREAVVSSLTQYWTEYRGISPSNLTFNELYRAGLPSNRYSSTQLTDAPVSLDFGRLAMLDLIPIDFTTYDPHQGVPKTGFRFLILDPDGWAGRNDLRRGRLPHDALRVICNAAEQDSASFVRLEGEVLIAADTESGRCLKFPEVCPVRLSFTINSDGSAVFSAISTGEKKATHVPYVASYELD